MVIQTHLKRLFGIRDEWMFAKGVICIFLPAGLEVCEWFLKHVFKSFIVD